MLLVNGYRKTTAPGEREERHQRGLSYNNSSRDEQVDTRLATYPKNLIIDTLSLPLPTWDQNMYQEKKNPLW